jgi:hypothetical protein
MMSSPMFAPQSVVIAAAKWVTSFEPEQLLSVIGRAGLAPPPLEVGSLASASSGMADSNMPKQFERRWCHQGRRPPRISTHSPTTPPG